MKKHSAFIVSYLGFLISTQCIAAPAPLPVSTVGNEITAKIKLLVSSCMGPNTFKDSFIPGDFITDPQLSSAFNKNSLAADVSFKRLATRIFKSNPTIGEMNVLETKNNTLNIVVPETAPLTDSTNVIYSLGCSSSLKLALEQGFKLPSLGGATDIIKQSLNAEANGGKNSKLLIMYGDFKNPVASMLSPTAIPIDARVAAYAAVWRFMLDNRLTSLNSPGKYIASLRGWVVANSSLEELSGVLNASAAVNPGKLLFTANLSGQTSYQYSSKYSSNIYRIHFDPVTASAGNGSSPNVEPADLPTPDEIIAVIDSAAEVTPSSVLYLPQSPVAIRALIPGLGQQSFLCAKDLWTISSTDSDVSPNSTNPAIVAAKLLEGGVCQLDGYVTIQKPGVTKVNVNFINTGYPITTTDSVKRGLAVKRTIPTTTVELPTAYFLSQPIASLVPESAPPVFSIKTSLSYFSKGSISNINFSALKINCGAAGIIPNIANIDPVPHAERFLTDLTITAGALSNTAPDWSACVLEGDILTDYMPPDGGALVKSYALRVKSLPIGFKQ